ncbi:NAD(P)H-dependent oxidoreductase [Chitiniphilus purpureus]|uniref:FMN dependent NADH:quinone oxidoreductase n=1 Tax=Chitiniphilus purpureus TaxID=2981137 RepID=A0ABY6DPR2_9NEIS|nr:NAD(P)H-dependent oxidoreductase [Chitiniphilus sp. CD1]UXY16350.1 NAD(P)H-dependent oxidoreductase [Chitiniphilus sp. CD1]
MSHLLHITASPDPDTAHSAGVARELLAAYQARHPAHAITTLDLWGTTLPEFDATMIAAKFAVLRTQEASAGQQARWAEAVAISAAFNAADRYVFSLPMWNFGIPYRLKHYIDIVTLPGQNWSWSRAQGYRPLLSGKRAVLVYSSAGDFPVPPPPDGYADFQKPFMRQWLRFLGIEVVDEIVVAPTLTDPDRLAQIRDTGLRHARAAALAL